MLTINTAVTNGFIPYELIHNDCIIFSKAAIQEGDTKTGQRSQIPNDALQIALTMKFSPSIFIKNC
jgi:hypothetical protein